MLRIDQQFASRFTAAAACIAALAILASIMIGD